MKSIKFKKNIFELTILLSFTVGILGIEGCQLKTYEKLKSTPSHERKIKNLIRRVEIIEKKQKQSLTSSKVDSNYPKGPIKYLTFRLGTKDDRLRIYWENGSNSDLPCTKEQLIWVCG